MNLRCKSALLLYVVIGVVLRHSYGTYHPGLLLVLTAVFAVFAVVTLRGAAADADEPNAKSAESALAATLAFFAYLLWLTPALQYATVKQWGGLMRMATATTMVASLGLLVQAYLWPRASLKSTLAALAVVFALLTGEHVLTPLLSPKVPIDVLIINNSACEHLEAGRNPYTQEYPDIYQGKFDYKPKCAYWPGYYYWAVPFHAWLGDVRYANAAAECLTALLLLLLGYSRGLPAPTSAFLAVLWMANPMGLFVLERAWIDPVMMMGIAFAALCLERRWWWLLGVAVGFVAGVKQLGVIVGLFTLIYLWARERAAAARMVAAATVTLGLLVGPYLVLDWRAFYESSVEQIFTVQMRMDALSWPVLWSNITRHSFPQFASLAIYVTSLGFYCYWVYRRAHEGLQTWIAGIALMYMTLFLWGKIAFCNYYHFTSFLFLLYLLLALDGRSKGEDGRPATEASGP